MPLGTARIVDWNIGFVPPLPVSPPPPSPIPSPVPVGFCTTMFDSFTDRTLTNTLGVTSVGGRAWTTTAVSGLSDYGVGFGGPFGGYARNNGASSFGSLIAHVGAIAGDPWTLGAKVDFSLNFTQNGQIGVGADTSGVTFELELESFPNCDTRFVVFMTNGINGGTHGLIAVEDQANGWFAQITKSDWISNQEYVMDGYADEHVGAGIRVYPVGSTPPSWTSFTYNDGSVIGMDATVNPTLFLSSIPSPSLFNWRNLSFCAG